MKRLWSLINNIIGKANDKTSVIKHITVENVCYYDAEEVDNKFGEFYSTIGTKLAQNIDKTETNIKTFLNKCDTNPLMALVASRFAVYSGKLHQRTKITGNDITDDIIILMMS